MERKKIIKTMLQVAVFILFCINVVVIRAAEPEFDFRFIPPLGELGNAQGRVVMDGLNAGNAKDYAVIAMLHAVWEGGGDYYVKPYANNYLNPVDDYGIFSILITTGGIDADVDEVIFYFVERSAITDNDVVNPTAMAGKYLATQTIYRSVWVNPQPAVMANIPPGVVLPGTKITLSSSQGGAIYYTLDASDPATSPTAEIYNNTEFTVPEHGALLIKATAKISDSFSPVFSLTWLPKEPVNTPFWGLNVSLALNGEPFGYQLSEITTRERILPVSKLTKWIRTFRTINNGQEYINKIAKELGLSTMIGLYITNDATNNSAQIEGLRQILQTGPAPDLITVGNETSLLGVTPATLISCIEEVRKMVSNQGLVIPIGSVDIANIAWNYFILEKLDFIGVNIYCGTWDNINENLMLDATKQTFAETVSLFQSKLVLLTETGTPYSGGSYSVDGGTQTASVEKAVHYLSGFLDWIQKDQTPSFYFEAYDEPIKSQNGGHPIEEYFGIMNGNLEIHSFYRDLLPASIEIIGETLLFSAYPNPVNGLVTLVFEAEGAHIVTLAEMSGRILLRETANGQAAQIDLSDYPAGVYLLTMDDGKRQSTMRIVKR